MTWTPTGIDGVFFISVLTILSGSFGLAVKYCLKSKCEDINLCFGLFKVKRRVDLEVQEEISKMELGIIEEPKNISPKPSNSDLKKYIPQNKKLINEEIKIDINEY